MRVCHISSVHSRYDVRIFEKECTTLAEKGHEVFFVVNDTLDSEMKNGVTIVPTQFVASNRFQRMFKSMKYILEKAEEINADIYHLHDPELLRIVGKLATGKRKIIFDAHEDTEIQIMDKEWIPYFARKIIAKGYAMYAGKILRKCSGVVTVTPAIVEKMKCYNDNVVMVTNYPIIEQTKPKREEMKDNYVFFAGGISKQWCHERIINAVNQIPDVYYKMAGPVEPEYFEHLKTCQGWDRVDYLGKVPHDKVEELYCGAIAGMAVNECSQIKGEGTLGNTKLFEIMSASTPLICTDYRLWKEIVEKKQCGICIRSDDVEAIRKAIIYLRDHREEAEEMGRRGREAIEREYNWKNEGEKLVNMYEELSYEVKRS